MAVIGLDFGNYNSYPSFVHHIDEQTRLGGRPYDLVASNYRNGIPSAYYCSPQREVLLGNNALGNRARVADNRFRYLKRDLGKTLYAKDTNGEATIPVSIDDAITAVIEHCVRLANEQLEQNFQLTTNKISLAYPASFFSSQRQHLISLAEKATLKDGTHLEVVGTIKEPAAAALDYLADEQTEQRDTTVLTYDLGGGTFDLGLVSAYPNGRLNSNNQKYFYDIVGTAGLSDVGGKEFDDVVYKILKSQISESLSSFDIYKLHTEATIAKENLSDLDNPNEIIDFPTISGELHELRVTREEFERESRPLIQKTIDATRKLLAKHPNQKPEIILLSGGASQMPMVKDALEAAFPEYRGKVKKFRPNLAISYGAARYGTIEPDEDSSTTIVQKHVDHDIGIRYFKDINSNDEYIDTVIKADTPLPFKPIIKLGYKHSEGSISTYSVYEAKCDNPDCEEIDRDWTYIMQVDIDFGRVMPKNSPSEVEFSIDHLGSLHLAARDTSVPNQPYFKNSVQLKNISTK